MSAAAADLARLQELCRAAACNATDPDVAIALGALYGNLSWRNNAGLLGDEAFEMALHEKFAAPLKQPDSILPTTIAAVDVTHVISEAYEFGGHTRLLLMLLEGLREARGCRQRVAVTRHAPATFVEQVEALRATVQVLSGGALERVRSLVALGQQTSVIVLHIHPDDLAAALAARTLRLQGKTVLYVNHADHVFSFGAGAASAVLEISAFGWQATQSGRSALAQSYLGIPVLRSAGSDEVGPRSGFILSIGNAYKYAPASDESFPEFLLQLLERVDNNVRLIGPNGDDPWWHKVVERFPGRVQFMGFQPRAVAEAQRQDAACYVDSFPVIGGSAFAEALVSGQTVFGLGRETAGGYSLADSLRSGNGDELLAAMTRYLQSGQEPPEQQAVRERIASRYTPEAVAMRLVAAAEGRYEPIPEALGAVPADLNHHCRLWRSAGKVVPPEKQRWADIHRPARRALAARLLTKRWPGMTTKDYLKMLLRACQ